MSVGLTIILKGRSYASGPRVVIQHKMEYFIMYVGVWVWLFKLLFFLSLLIRFGDFCFFSWYSFTENLKSSGQESAKELWRRVTEERILSKYVTWKVFKMCYLLCLSLYFHIWMRKIFKFLSIQPNPTKKTINVFINHVRYTLNRGLVNPKSLRLF